MPTTRRDFLIASTLTSLAAACDRHARGESLTSPAEPSAPGSAAADALSRGVGVYPGRPAEYAGAWLVPGGSEYRNLALRRPAYHSSSYDYNLTAQLVTDGIATTDMPTWLEVSIQDRILPKEEREVVIDHAPVNLVSINGHHATVDLHLAGGLSAPAVDRLDLFLVLPSYLGAAELQFRASVSDDGYHWQQVGSSGAGAPLPTENFPPDMVKGNHVYAPSLPFGTPAQSRFYRVELLAPQSGDDASSDNFPWQLGQIAFFRSDRRVEIGGPYSFTSAWRAAGLDQEWVYVDLLKACTFDTVKLHWIAPPAAGSLQVSNDAVHWRDIHALSGTTPVEELRVAATARYIRVLLTKPATGAGYILSEFEVFGRGGLAVKPQPARAAEPDGSVVLSCGAWKVQRDSEVHAGGEQLATVGFADSAWLPATVPGTTLSSFLDAGALPDPNFGQNQLFLSDSYFYADFWYRTEFVPPAVGGERQWLHFDGVNWKADVYLNGHVLGHVDGAFFRGRFDVTDKLKHGQRNALAVCVRKNATPGSVHQKTYQSVGKNGGGLGADNPTFHASVGWDWIPTIRGRNTGIWNEVRLVQTGSVVLSDPLVRTQLAAAGAGSGPVEASVTLSVRARNGSPHPSAGTVSGRLGDVTFSKTLTLSPGEEQEVVFDATDTPALRMRDARLWWPVGYGEPYLYDAEIRFQPDGATADARPLRFKAGLRQMTSATDGGRLRLFLNGRRFIARGGNWGFSESMLRYRAREYDAAVRYHREMNFNIIRNWVGQIGEDAFYEACDRHGVVVWQDFWLANPWDGPVPEDNAMFLQNARDLVSRIRRHGSIGLYCGRNEWYPPQALEKGLRDLLGELHPDIPYTPSSADGPVSGHGPYNTLSPRQYFLRSDSRLHSEIGAPCIPTLDSVRAMMPQDALWPQGLDYGLHDFTLQGAQGATTLLALIEDVYGGATDAADWVQLAQFLNYDTYRAMFEAQSRDRMGVLLWMSHSCWPSFVWQTYDYYLEPTAAYFACRKACEPVHIQWNPLTEKVEVVNYNAGRMTGLEAVAELLNPDGTQVFRQQASLDCDEDSTHAVIDLTYPAALGEIHFLRLTLRAGDRVVSSNTYLRAREQGNLRAIRRLGRATLQVDTTITQDAGTWKLEASVRNTSAVPALMTRVKAVGSRDGQRILPALYNDNYVTLLPGEQRTVSISLDKRDARAQKPAILLEGFNVSTVRNHEPNTR